MEIKSAGYRFLGRDGKHIFNGKSKENCSALNKMSVTLKKRFQSGEIAPWCKGKKLPESVRKKLSESMKKAHMEGRAHNFKIRRKSEKSYPEKFFEGIIEREFIDKKYEYDYRIGKWWGDFVWLHKKLVIEIDGEQHLQKERMESDQRKDKYLVENGWKVLRITWSRFMKDTQNCIKEAKEFVHNGNIA